VVSLWVSLISRSKILASPPCRPQLPVFSCIPPNSLTCKLILFLCPPTLARFPLDFFQQPITLTPRSFPLLFAPFVPISTRSSPVSLRLWTHPPQHTSPFPGLPPGQRPWFPLSTLASGSSRPGFLRTPFSFFSNFPFYFPQPTVTSRLLPRFFSKVGFLLLRFPLLVLLPFPLSSTN